MPIYEYQCRSCGAEFEDLVRLGTPDEEIGCPSCGEHQSQRQLSVFSGRRAASSGSSAALGASPACGPSGFS